MAEHTNEIWQAHSDSSGDYIAEGDRPVMFAPAAAYVPDMVAGRDEVRRKVRLAASAPRLLEALGQCLQCLRVWRAHLDASDPTLGEPDVIRAIKQAEAAIAEAEEA